MGYHRADDSYCCECDYGETHNYYSFCEQHRPEAEAHVQKYLAEHPGVVIESDED